jgi:hypothetical protein
MSTSTPFIPDELPALYKASNIASLDAQTNALWLLRAELFFMIIAAIATSISIDDATMKKIAAGIAAGAMIFSLASTLTAKLWKQDKKWYTGRALAESVKSLSWRFMTGSDPYSLDIAPQEAEKHFSRCLLDMMKQIRDTPPFSIDNHGDEKQITEMMRIIRHLPLQDRLSVYLEYRIRDQRKWYSDKARSNMKASNTSLVVIIAVQIIAIASAIFLIYKPSFPINLSSILITVATAFIAWLQMKRHQELFQSYSIAAHELGFVEEQAEYISSETDFSNFVSDAENAISREHTLWTARRDVFTYSRQG